MDALIASCLLLQHPKGCPALRYGQCVTHKGAALRSSLWPPPGSGLCLRVGQACRGQEAEPVAALSPEPPCPCVPVSLCPCVPVQDGGFAPLVAGSGCRGGEVTFNERQWWGPPVAGVTQSVGFPEGMVWGRLSGD